LATIALHRWRAINFDVGVFTKVGSVFNQPDHNGCRYNVGAEYSTEFAAYVEGAGASGQFVA
jgi:hypothetical protein